MAVKMWHSCVFQFLLIGGIPLVLGVLTRDYTGTPCAGDVVSLTCTVPGSLLQWDIPGTTRNIVLDSGTVLPFNRDQYTVTSLVINSTSFTSDFSFPAAEGLTIGCFGIQLELRDELTIETADIPSPPNGFSYSILNSSLDGVSVTVGWTLLLRLDLNYTVTIASLAQLSATVLTSTSVTVTAQYNVDYTVSVVATNCAGNSTTAEYNFRIGGCPVLTNPMNGAFGPVSNRLPGSTVTIQCDAGYVSAIVEVMCEEGTLMWSPDPETIMCVSLTQAPPTNQPTPPPMNCAVPLSPPQNGVISDHSVPATPSTQVTFQCDDGLFPEGIMTATCLATGEWDKIPREIVCRNESISCVLPAPPLNGALLNTNCQNTNLVEGSVITFQCDPGFSLVGAVTVTCNNSGLWDPDLALLECIYSFPSPTLSTEEAVSVSVVVTAVVFIVIGFLAGLLVTHICSRKKAVYYPATEGQANVRPTVPPGPVYEEVLPKEEIELNTNQAYGPVGL